MPRRINRNFLFLAVALLFGVVASFLAVRYVRHQVAARTRKAPTQATTRVVVPVRDLPEGATLQPGDVAARAVPSDLIPADAVTPANYQNYLGQVLRAPLTRGVPIPGTAVESLTAHFSSIIQPDDVAYSI